jgi:hypothetical protein
MGGEGSVDGEVEGAEEGREGGEGEGGEGEKEVRMEPVHVGDGVLAARGRAEETENGDVGEGVRVRVGGGIEGV